MWKKSVLTVILLWTSIRPTDLSLVTVNLDQKTSVLNENDDSETLLANVSAQCNNTTPSSINCHISYNPDSKLFSISDNKIYKLNCSTPSCGACPSCRECLTSNGCLNGPATYNINVTCNTTSHHCNGTGTSTLTVNVTEETPELNIPESVNANNLMSVGTVVAAASTSTELAIVNYTKSLGVSNTYLLNTANMFELNTTSGDVYVATDPSVEYDYTFVMGICIYSRRQNSCRNLTIKFDGCFQTPNCSNQTGSFSDQHGIGDTLFSMIFGPPSDHFYAISPTWQNLTFEKDSSTLAEASIDLTTGNIFTTGNVTVWPYYPHRTHTFVVKVSNPGHSCSYHSTCNMTMQFNFTNWDIKFVSQPTSYNIHEDTDGRTLLFNITTYDYNNPEHDNVTCNVTDNDEPTLLELIHNGENDYDSYSIYKKQCNDSGCGYINDSFLCPNQSGCLNYDLENEYKITINCSDAYGSNATEAFTLKVTENQPPSFNNITRDIIVNTDTVANHDTIFSIYYSDAERETLDYNFTITPSEPSLFMFDTRGNYHNEPANVTATISQWDLANATFAVSFCGRERRNIVCSNFNITIREFCGPTPECSHDSTTVTDQFAIGAELFQINVTGSGYTSLTYEIIIPDYPNLFHVDRLTGIVTSEAALEARNPPGSSTYSIVANVYDTAACGYAACALSVEVTFTNFNISIDNMGSVNVDIHEDEQASVTLVTIETSDPNPNDGVTCEVDNAASSPANSSIFFAVETDTGSNVYELVSKEGPGFDYDVSNNYTVVVVCEDNYGSSDTATATVNILENQVPTMDNLKAGDVINVDPITVGNGDVIFTLQTSDDEDDPLLYSCSVTNNFVPLQCLSDGVVSLRREVRIPDEEGEMYNITLCIEDSVHNHTVCETLNVNISSSKTNPVLNNLPDSVSFDEDSAVGVTLFTATVDPDSLNVYTFSMTVYPKTTRSTFSLDANTGVLTLQESLDYETQNHYEFLFSVRDVYLPGLEDKYLNLSVLDVNEAPTLTLTETTYATIEEDAGYTVATLRYTCTDVDAGQTMHLAITSGTNMSYFSLDSSTGVLTFAQNWDFESGAQQTTSLGITCDDGNGLSDSGTIVVNIAAVNEFSPVLSTTSEDITIYSNQTLFDPLFTITADDNDYGDDGLFDFSILGEGKGSKYFTISSTGQLFIANYIDWNYDYNFEFTIKVSDGETLPHTSHVNVIVRFMTSYNPTIPTKESARCLVCTKIGRAVVSCMCVEAVIVLSLFVHMCRRMKAYQICQLNPKPRLQTVSDIKKAIQDRSDTDEAYRPGSEMSDGRPPSPFIYNRPPRGESKAAADPGPAISLAHISGRQKPANFGLEESSSSARVRNNKRKTKHVPSLFQSKAYAPASINLPSSVDETFITDQRPAHKVSAINPLFDKPNYSVLFRENARQPQVIGEAKHVLDF